MILDGRPWSPESGVESEANGLVSWLVHKPLLKDDVIADISLGAFHAAEAALAKAASSEQPHRSHLAFLAMTQHQLGQIDTAKATVARLREALKESDQDSDDTSRALLREAEATLAEPVIPADPFAR